MTLPWRGRNRRRWLVPATALATFGLGALLTSAAAQDDEASSPSSRTRVRTLGGTINDAEPDAQGTPAGDSPRARSLGEGGGNDGAGDAPRTHTVKRGDTLWDISATYFRDPWRWPKVWALNPEIANPHWIFPGQIIRLRPEQESLTASTAGDGNASPAAETPPPDHELPPAPPPLPAEARGLRQIGFIDEDGLKASGTINGSLEEKILLATGDHVYLKFPADKVPPGGARFTIYQVDRSRPVREPGSSTVLGYVAHIYGDVVVDSQTDRPIVNARLLDLTEPVERGYLVGPVMRQFKAVNPRTNESNLSARVVAAVQPNMLIGNHMFVILDRGRRHGVEEGNRFLVLRQGDGLRRVLEDWDTVDHRFPPHAVAEILAVDVQKETTIGWISRGTRELHVGDVADLRQGY